MPSPVVVDTRRPADSKRTNDAWMDSRDQSGGGRARLRPAGRSPEQQPAASRDASTPHWLYGSQYEKLWNRFSPDMRQTFGSVADLASFAGTAVTRLGREQGQVDEKVETASPLRIYSRTSTFDRSRHKMLLEWTMAEDGEVTGLVLRPALDGETR